MNEAGFWQIIDESRASGDLNEHLMENLSTLGVDELLSFHSVLTQKLAQSYVFPLLAANFVISSYVSDDGFGEFRAWLISQGFKKFYDALEDPETIADWLDKSDVDHIQGEALLLAAPFLYEEMHGEDFWERVDVEPEPAMEINWPEDKQGFRERWPKLVDKF